MTTINIANDFSLYPGGRYPEDGPKSGQEFRESFLVPLLQKDEPIRIELDGTRGYGSSFLEEVFGGLVRKGFSPQMILSKIRLITSRPGLQDEITEYIKNAN
ncbi:MAG: STAS-like domain-containing protein [Desulfovibrio sp.]|nr:STAS-like domain-containing protein [Desulfovibrio sp.]